MVLKEGKTIVLDDYPARPEAVAAIRDAGFRSVVASPVWVGGWLAAVLIGGSRQKRCPLPQEVDAFELLAAQAGLSLENVRRYEDELRAVERLQELDRLKSDFLATVSHELRTPVTVIEGIGLTLEQSWARLDDPTRQEMLAGLGANARSLDTIITTLLDFSRLEAGHLEVNFGLLHLTDALRHTAGRLGGLFSEHRFIVDVEPDLVVSADPVLIERAIENLLSNAAKHTPAQTTVRLSAHLQDGDVIVAVTDDGPGIAEDEVAHLGERFFRGGDVNTRQRGIGLGLALVREMLELHKTELHVVTEVGEGSIFSFRLPSAAVPEPSDQQRVVRARN